MISTIVPKVLVNPITPKSQLVTIIGRFADVIISLKLASYERWTKADGPYWQDYFYVRNQTYMGRRRTPGTAHLAQSALR